MKSSQMSFYLLHIESGRSTKDLHFFSTISTHQRPLKAGGIVETSTHDQKRPLLVQLIGDCLDLLIQRQHLLNQLWSSRKIKIVKIVVKKKLLDKERATEREHNKASCLRLIWPD